MLLPGVKYFCMAQRLINRKQIQFSMKQFRLSHFLLLFSLIALVSFTIDKGKKKKPAGKTRTAKVAKKPRPVIADEEAADNPYYIIVDKSDYELKVYDEEGWYATYPIVFGSKDLSDKMKEGDKRTPDGQFKVVLKKIHPKWGPELLLDYPNGVSIQKFNQRKASGLIPKNAKIGDGIAIHATRPDEEWTVDNFYNWTDGCVSVKYTEMKDLFSYIPVGTKVTIQQ
jgi:murein L,D-transpeptidase YafK